MTFLTIEEIIDPNFAISGMLLINFGTFALTICRFACVYILFRSSYSLPSIFSRISQLIKTLFRSLCGFCIELTVFYVFLHSLSFQQLGFRRCRYQNTVLLF